MEHAPSSTQPAKPESQDWLYLQINHEYRLGRFPVVSKRFDVGWRSFSLAELGDLPPAPPVPETPIEKRQDGYVIYSYPVADGMPRLAREDWAIRYIPRRFVRYFIDLEMSTKEYRAQLSSSTRTSLLQQVRKFEEISGGKIDWREYRSPDEIREFHPLARQISAKTYQEPMGRGLPDSKEEREHMFAEAAKGRIRAYLLFLNGQVIAYLFCPFNRRVLEYGYTGYNPEYRKLSPGSVLLWLALDRWFADPACRYFDFAGAERAGTEQKRRLATHRLQCGHVWFLRRNLKNSALVLLLSGVDLAYLAGFNVVARVGLMPRLKKLLRRV